MTRTIDDIWNSPPASDDEERSDRTIDEIWNSVPSEVESRRKEDFWDMVMEREPKTGPRFTDQTDDQLREQILSTRPAQWFHHPGEAIRGIPRGAANTAIAALAGGTQLAGEALNLAGVDYDVVDWARETAKAAQGAVNRAVPASPGMEDSWAAAIGEGLGSAGVSIPAAIAGGPAGLAAFGGTAMYSSTYDQARELGATPDQARWWARLSGLVGGATEPAGGVLPAIRMFERANRASGNKLLPGILKAGSREALQEMVQETPDELGLRQAYIEERTLFDSLKAIGEAGALGGIVGVLLPGMGAAAQGSLGLARVVQERGLFRKKVEVEPAAAEDGITLEAEGPPVNPMDLPPELAHLKPGETVLTDYGREIAAKEARPEGSDAKLLADYRARKAAGQKDPMPNADAFEEAGLGRPTRKERAAIIKELETKETTSEPGGTQRPQGPDDAAVRQAEPQAEAAKAQAGQAAPQGSSVLTPAAAARAAGDVDSILAPPPSPEAEANERRAVGGYNAAVDRDRVERGRPPLISTLRKSNPQVFDEAMRVMEANSHAQDALLLELQTKPRPVFPYEHIMLLHRYADVSNEYHKAVDRQERATAAGETAQMAELDATIELLDGQLSAVEEAMRATGTLGGQSQQIRQLVMFDDYSFERMKVRERKSRGVDRLTKEQTEQVRAEAKAIAELQRQLDEKQKTIDDLERQKAVDAAIAAERKASEPKRTTRRAKAKTEIEAAWKELEGVLSAKLFSNPLDPEVIAAGVKLARAYIRAGVATWKDFREAMVARIGEEKAAKAHDAMAQAWQTAVNQERPKKPTKLDSNAAMTRYATRLLRFFINSGIDDRTRLIDAVHAEMAKAVPGLTRRQAMEALSGYGQFRPLSKEEVEKRRRQVRGEVQQLLKLEDMSKGQAPPRMGVEMPEPGDEWRRLLQQVNEMKRRGGFDVTDPARQARTALQAWNKRLDHQIADLETEIRDLRRNVPTKTKLAATAEIKKKQERIDLLRGVRDDVFGRPELSDEQRLQLAEKAVERAAAKTKQRLETGDLDPRPPGKKVLRSERLNALRDEHEALKAQLAYFRALNNPKLTPDERALRGLKAAKLRTYADYSERIAKGDYEPRKRKKTKLDEEVEWIAANIEKKKKEFRRRLEANRRARRTKVQVVTETTGELLFHVQRALAFGLDFGFLGLHAGGALAGHPIRTSRQFVESLRAWNELSDVQLRNIVANRPNAKSGLDKRSGLDKTFSDPAGALGRQEELVMGHLVDRIPILRNMNRIWSTFLNAVRASYADTMWANLEARAEITDERAGVIANAVGVATGRGRYGRTKIGEWTLDLDGALTLLNAIFLAPRWVASRFQIVLGQPLWHGDSHTRRVIAEEYARTIAGITAFTSLVYLSMYALRGAPGDDKDWDINFNPFAQDAGIRIGTRSFDPFMGLRQATTVIGGLGGAVLSKLLYGEFGAIGFERPASDTAKRLLRYKLAPVPGAVYSYFHGTLPDGRPATPWELTKQLAIPVNARDIYTNLVKSGMPEEKALSAVVMFGLLVRVDEMEPAERAMWLNRGIERQPDESDARFKARLERLQERKRRARRIAVREAG